MNGCPLFLGKSLEAEVEPSEQYLHMIWEQCMIIMTKKRGKFDLFSYNTLLPYFMAARCVFFCQSVSFFTNAVY